MPLLLLFLGGVGGYCGASTIGGIGIAVGGTAFGISASAVTAAGVIGGASVGFVSGIAIENVVNQKQTKRKGNKNGMS